MSNLKKPKQTLSASKIKTFKECSWKYWCKYVLKIPDTSNDGAKRGSICHLVFECLGNPRHKKRHYKDLLENGIKSGSSVDLLIEKWSRKLELDLDTEEDILSKNLINSKLDMLGDHVNGNQISNRGIIYSMIDEGLKYDFYGDSTYAPSESFDEIDFNIETENYKIRGFIDKLFIYKKEGKILIRDFKTSKQSFKGKDAEDNIQSLMYALAIRDLYPEFIKQDIKVEFVFLRLMGRVGDKVRCDVSPTELDGFEFILSQIQDDIDNFNIESAKSNFSHHQGMPKDGSFSGQLLCGFAKEKGQLKKNGLPMWHCPVKFDLEYYALVDENDEVQATSFDIDDLLENDLADTCRLEHKYYSGCPAHKG